MNKRIQKSPTTNKTVGLSPKLQVYFLIAITIFWAAEVGAVATAYVGPNAYVNAGTWAYQISQWLLPVVYVVLAYGIMRKKYHGFLNRLFMAGFVSSIALMLFYAFFMIENTVRFHLKLFIPDYTNTGLWNAFGHDWVVMLLGLAAYVAVLARQEEKLKKHK